MHGALDPEVLGTFLEEVRAYVPDLHREVAALRADADPESRLSEIHRLVHSIRSASEMIGLARLTAAARGVEDAVVAGPELVASVNEDLLARLAEGIREIEAELAAGRVAPSFSPVTPAPATQIPTAHTPATYQALEAVSDDLWPTFSSEAEQQFEMIAAGCQALNANPGDPAPLAEIRRAVHTLKGAAGMVGLDATSTFAHRIEDVLDLIVGGRLPLADEIRELLVAGFDLLNELVSARGRNESLLASLEEQTSQFEALVSLAAEETAAASEPAPPGTDFSEVDEVDADLLDTFLTEAEAHLEQAGAALRELAAEPANPRPWISQLRRSVHTLKGAAGMVGLMTASAVARALQFLLDRVEEGTQAYTPEIRELCQDSIDRITDLIAASGQNQGQREAVESLLARLQAPASTSALSTPAEESDATAPLAAPAADAGPSIRAPLERLDQLMQLVGDLFVNSSFFEQQLHLMGKDLEELGLSLSRLRRIANVLDDIKDATVGSSLEVHASPSAADFDALEFDRYTQLSVLSRDLTEASSDLATLSSQLRMLRGNLHGQLDRQRSVSGEVQDKLMRLRRIPLSTLANRLYRTVRVASGKTGKPAELVMSGLEVEIDKAMADHIAGPLEHLLRNAVDHGLESPEQRMQAGKPRRGTVHMDASVQNGYVVLRLSDDGRGLDYGKIRRQAVRLGWLDETRAATTADSALRWLILEPGFSTADSVSDISGRGVGLDVVRSAVESFKGTMQVDSVSGQGTTFTLRLPLSMAVASILMLEVRGEKFGIPVGAVVNVERGEGCRRYKRSGLPWIEAGGVSGRLFDLGDWLGLPRPVDVPSAAEPLYVLIQNGEDKHFLQVDRVLESREVIVKPLTGLLDRLDRFGGACVLGDGSVVLVLNPSQLGQAGLQTPWSAARSRRRIKVREILVVDDSLSIRRSLANLIRAAGWNCTLARDGVEALELLGRMTQLPDLVVMDIEMPRMDGYQLATQIRAAENYRHLPIIMLTSRAGDKHRDKAVGLGVNGYLVKPCPDDVLMDTLQQHLPPIKA